MNWSPATLPRVRKKPLCGKLLSSPSVCFDHEEITEEQSIPFLMLFGWWGSCSYRSPLPSTSLSIPTA